MVYAVRDIREAIFKEELEQEAAKRGNFKLVILESDKGHFARVDIMKTKLDAPLDAYDYFLCGPKPMVKRLQKDLMAAAVPKTSIHTETFEFR